MIEEIKKYIDKTAVIDINGMQVHVKIVDVKNSYGRDRYRIEPVAGSVKDPKGVWVEKVTLLN